MDSVVSKDLLRLAVQWGLPWAQPLAPLPWASLCISGLSKEGQAWGCPPHSTALTPPLPFPQPPPLPVVLVELWESSGFWRTPTFYPRPFITLSQIFVLADKSLVLELSPGGQAVSAGGTLDSIQPTFPTPTVHAEKLRPRERPGFSQGYQSGRGRVKAWSRLLEAEPNVGEGDAWA